MARIVDEIVEIAPLVGIQHVYRFGHSPVNGREGRLVHVVAGIFGTQVMSLAEGLATQLFSQGNPGFHDHTSVDLTVPHRLEPLRRRAVVHQLHLLLGEVTLQQPEGHVMRTGMELHRDRSVPQSTGVAVRRVWTYHDRLTHHRGTQRNDLRSLLALIGPPDLSFFSGPIDGHPGFLKSHVAQDRVDLCGVFRMWHNPTRAGADELHINAFGLTQHGHNVRRTGIGRHHLQGKPRWFHPLPQVENVRGDLPTRGEDNRFLDHDALRVTLLLAGWSTRGWTAPSNVRTRNNRRRRVRRTLGYAACGAPVTRFRRSYPRRVSLSRNARTNLVARRPLRCRRRC